MSNNLVKFPKKEKPQYTFTDKEALQKITDMYAIIGNMSIHQLMSELNLPFITSSPWYDYIPQFVNLTYMQLVEAYDPSEILELRESEATTDDWLLFMNNMGSLAHTFLEWMNTDMPRYVLSYTVGSEMIQIIYTKMDGLVYLKDIYMDHAGTVGSIGLKSYCEHFNMTYADALNEGMVEGKATITPPWSN